MAVSSLTLGLFDAVGRPSTFVQSQVDTYTNNRLDQVIVGTRLSGFYILNLLLYAGPLTLAGFGETRFAFAPGPLIVSFLSLFVSDVNAAFGFFIRLLQNSAFIFVASALVLLTFHLGLLLTRSSRGLLQSIHTVTYSIGVYLAVVFTLAWYISTAEAIVVADDWLIALQKEYIYFFIDLVGVDVGLPGGRPGSVDLSRLTDHGQLALAILFIAVLYFVYTLYLGARMNHNANRVESGIAVGTVAIAPALYVIGSIMLTVYINLQEIITGFIA